MPRRIVVVGAGVVGLLTALECADSGAEVDLVDRAEIPSPSATSNDLHRVVRAFHRGDAALTSAAARALERWPEIERRTGARFFHRTGALTVLPAGEVPETAVAENLTPAELSARYPQVRFPAGMGGVLEHAAGTVQAGRALAELAALLRSRPGVTLHPHRPVVSVADEGDVLFADGTHLTGDGVVIAAGPWSRALVPAAVADDLVLCRQTVLSYAPAPSREAWAGTPAMPSLGTGGAWLTPPVAGTPVRLSAASACRAVAVAAPADRITPRRWRDHLVDLFARLLTGFDPAAVTGATEGYYLTAASTGGGPLLVRLGDGRTCAYAACGGLSFKFAPLIAAALADRALGRPARRSGLDPVDRPRWLGAARGGGRP